MTTMAFFEPTNERLFLDASWFLLLCVIFALLRFHKWRKEPKPDSGREPERISPTTGVSKRREKAA
jgi:hypothetical protein